MVSYLVSFLLSNVAGKDCQSEGMFQVTEIEEEAVEGWENENRKLGRRLRWTLR